MGPPKNVIARIVVPNGFCLGPRFQSPVRIAGVGQKSYLYLRKVLPV